MSMLGHIAVVDDEPDIRETIQDYLELKGYRVSCAADGKDFRQLVERSEFDLALLDVNMPGEDGLSLARFLRETKDVGIIFLTASSETVDRIVGLEIGADDYISKPFDLRELHARIKAVLRRLNSSRKKSNETTEDAIAFGDCMLSLEAHTLNGPDGEEITITSMEFDLLKTFAQNPNRVLSRDRLLDLAHNRDWDPYDRSIDIRITRLRRKIEKDPAKPEIIKTVRGAGYVFSLNDSYDI
ncbi:MAG: response regulator [Rhodospirillales bacterium]|jgi:DNA-binding response OmpR family regulator|nr:response regulator [Rhodospirillales bacterium]